MTIARIIYLLIALIASQSAWAMLDEHSFGDTAPASEQAAPELQVLDLLQPTDSDHGETAGCMHCCHCHFHPVFAIQPNAFDMVLAKRPNKLFRLAQAPANGYLKKLLRPPIG